MFLVRFGRAKRLAKALGAGMFRIGSVPFCIARRSRLGLILVAAVVAVGCGSSGSAGSGEPAESTSHQVLPPLLEQITAIPPDVPLSAPACNSSENLSLTNNNPTVATLVPPALHSLESTCSNYAGDDPEVMVIYNLTDDVLDVSAANGSAPVIEPKYPSSSGLLPSWDDLEIDEQNSVIQSQQSQAQQGTYLVPVGGEALVYMDAASPSLDVSVSVDAANSAVSYGAQLITGYVIDNLLDKISALSYASSIADCVNAAYTLWQDLSHRASASTTVLDALQTVPACQDLASKVREDRAEELAAADAKNLTRDALKPDIEKVADTANADSWETKIADLTEVSAEIEEAIR